MELEGMSLPFSMEAEQSVLGAVVIDPNCLTEIIGLVKPEYFYVPQHKELFSVMISMFNLNKTIDPVTLLEEIKINGVYDEAGGKQYLLQLAQLVPTAKNVHAYARIVVDKYYMRRLILSCRETMNDALEEAAEAVSILDAAEQRIMDIRDGKSNELRPIKEIIIETYDHITKLSSEGKDAYLGLPTGISALDRVITGLNKSDLLILAARPGVGKTSFALNIAQHVAQNSGKNVAFFSLEMSADQLVSRLLSSEASLDSRKLRTGELEAEDWSRLARAADALYLAPLLFDDTAGITVPEIKAKLRRVRNLGFVAIDYLQLMSGTRRNDNRVNEVSEITRSLKVLAKELRVPVMVLSQLSRATESRTGADQRPRLSDLRESGSIEQDADIVMFLYREDYYNKETENRNTAELIISKNRHGSTDTIPLNWQGEYTRFTASDRAHSEY